VSSVITLGSRGKNPDFRVLVFMGSGRAEMGLGGLRISETRGTTFLGSGFLGKVAVSGEEALVKLAFLGELGFFGE
jgi:hypothetical protein